MVVLLEHTIVGLGGGAACRREQEQQYGTDESCMHGDELDTSLVALWASRMD